MPPCLLRTGRSPRPEADAPDGTILLFTPHTHEAGKKLGTLGWVEGTTKTRTKKTGRQRKLGRHQEKGKTRRKDIKV